jgi:hypothetical protein
MSSAALRTWTRCCGEVLATVRRPEYLSKGLHPVASLTLVLPAHFDGLAGVPGADTSACIPCGTKQQEFLKQQRVKTQGLPLRGSSVFACVLALRLVGASGGVPAYLAEVCPREESCCIFLSMQFC